MIPLSSAPAKGYGLVNLLQAQSPHPESGLRSMRRRLPNLHRVSDRSYLLSQHPTRRRTPPPSLHPAPQPLDPTILPHPLSPFTLPLSFRLVLIPRLRNSPGVVFHVSLKCTSYTVHTCLKPSRYLIMCPSEDLLVSLLGVRYCI